MKIATLIALLLFPSIIFAKSTNNLDLALKIIACESSFRPHIWGDDKKSYGIAQFQKKTFYWLADKAKMKNMDWKLPEHQVRLLMWALDNGYGKYWTCYRKIKGR